MVPQMVAKNLKKEMKVSGIAPKVVLAADM